MTMKKKGFTLVELLVVIAIIGLLSSIAVVSLGSARGKARDAKRLADARQVATALEQYYSDNSGYPYAPDAGEALGSASGQANACGTAHLCTCLSNLATNSGIYDSCGTTTYMGTLPSYPAPVAACSGLWSTTIVPTANYCYFANVTSGSASAFKIAYILENNNPGGGGKNCITSNNGTTCT
jgi:prepilin-type N-terminal cleavage/methylation domain-containing protein